MAHITQTPKELPFLAVGRAEDAVTLASYSLCEKEEERRAIEEIFTKLLSAAKRKLKPDQRTRLQWNGGSVCCHMDAKGELLYCLVTSSISYPEKHAYRLIAEFMQVISKSYASDIAEMQEGGLTKALQKQMSQLLEKYETMAQEESSLSKAQQAVNVVQSTMRENYNIQMTNLGDAKEMEARTAATASTSARFSSQASELAAQERRKNIRNLLLLVGGVSCVLITVIIVIICCWPKGNGGNSPASNASAQPDLSSQLTGAEGAQHEPSMSVAAVAKEFLHIRG